MAEREIVEAAGAPAAIGPYSHAVRCGELLFCSGQIPIEPDSGEIVGADAAEQARRCLENLERSLCRRRHDTRARATPDDLHDRPGRLRGGQRGLRVVLRRAQPPARVAIGVAALPKGAQVEIDAIVAL